MSQRWVSAVPCLRGEVSEDLHTKHREASLTENLQMIDTVVTMVPPVSTDWGTCSRRWLRAISITLLESTAAHITHVSHNFDCRPPLLQNHTGGVIHTEVVDAAAATTTIPLLLLRHR